MDAGNTGLPRIKDMWQITFRGREGQGQNFQILYWEKGKAYYALA